MSKLSLDENKNGEYYTFNMTRDSLFKENKEIIPFKSSASLRTRLKDGLSLEEAIKKGKRKTGSPNGKFGPYIVENISYTSLPSIA